MDAIIERVRRLFGLDAETEAINEAVLAVMSREFSRIWFADDIELGQHIRRLIEINDWITTVEDRRVQRAYGRWVDYFAHEAMTRLDAMERAARIAAAKVSVPAPPSIARTDQGAP